MSMDVYGIQRSTPEGGARRPPLDGAGAARAAAAVRVTAAARIPVHTVLSHCLRRSQQTQQFEDLMLFLAS
jgi:hypothetical protein